MPAVAEPIFSQVLDDVVTLKGGLDQLTPVLSLPPSFCRDAENFECSVTGGYARVGGYERFDGRAKPSDAVYSIVQIATFINTPTAGQTLTGFTSGATGKIIALGDNYIVLTQTSGTFQEGELVEVGTTDIGVVEAISVTISNLLNAQYLNLAADVYRALIQKPPGSGPIRGVVSAIFGGVHKVYCFRDNVGATACLLYEATSSGWSAIQLWAQVEFTSGGTGTPSDGATLTQGANSATIKRVVLESGSWAAGTAAGRFIITAPTPGNFTAGAATVGAVNVTLSGIQTGVSFQPGGHFEFDVANFSGQLATKRIYGADGVNKCFEFDGEVVVPIRTGATDDTPKHIKVHHQHLLVSIGSSVMGSVPGLPYNWQAIDGAFEIAVGDTITNFLVQPGNQDSATLAIYTRNGAGMLYGTSAADFKFVAFTGAIGGLDYMAQNLEQSYCMDDRGLMNLRAAQEFGNFQQATLTNNIQTFIADKIGNSVCSSISKAKSQYRAFFADGSALYATIVNGKFRGAMPQVFPVAFSCAWNGELANGNDVSYVGGSDGMVYQLDRGSSFDGEAIDAYITLNWNFQKSPRVRKRYRGASIEVQGSTYAAIRFGYALGYNSSEIPQPSPRDYETELGGAGNWDQVNWDEFIWDGYTLSPTEAEMEGRAENVQVTLSSTTDYIYPYTLNSLIIWYSPGKRKRR
jgi:hypothetical protein